MWAINADAESDANKQPVALVQPYGELNSEIGALSVSQDGTLWLSATDGNLVYAYQAQTDTLSQWSLSGEYTIESVAASFINDNQAQLVLIDDETGAYIQANVNYAAQTSVSNSKVAMRAQLATRKKSICKARRRSAQPAPAFEKGACLVDSDARQRPIPT